MARNSLLHKPQNHIHLFLVPKVLIIQDLRGDTGWNKRWLAIHDMSRGLLGACQVRAVLLLGCSSCCEETLLAQPMILQGKELRDQRHFLKRSLKQGLDKVPHGRLVWNVRSHGIWGQFATWIQNWRKELKGTCGRLFSWLEACEAWIQWVWYWVVLINDLDANAFNIGSKFSDREP